MFVCSIRLRFGFCARCVCHLFAHLPVYISYVLLFVFLEYGEDVMSRISAHVDQVQRMDIIISVTISYAKIRSILVHEYLEREGLYTMTEKELNELFPPFRVLSEIQVNEHITKYINDILQQHQLEFIDVLLLEGLDIFPTDLMYEHIKRLFTLCEQFCANGKIKTYGFTSAKYGLPSAHQDFLSLDKIIDMAEQSKLIMLHMARNCSLFCLIASNVPWIYVSLSFSHYPLLLSV